MARTAAGAQWVMEIVPPRLICMARRPLAKKLDTIVEEVLLDGVLIEGFQTAIAKACSVQAEPNVQRYTAGFQIPQF